MWKKRHIVKIALIFLEKSQTVVNVFKMYFLTLKEIETFGDFVISRLLCNGFNGLAHLR